MPFNIFSPSVVDPASRTITLPASRNLVVPDGIDTVYLSSGGVNIASIDTPVYAGRKITIVGHDSLTVFEHLGTNITGLPFDLWNGDTGGLANNTAINLVYVGDNSNFKQMDRELNYGPFDPASDLAAPSSRVFDYFNSQIGVVRPIRKAAYSTPLTAAHADVILADTRNGFVSITSGLSDKEYFDVMRRGIAPARLSPNAGLSIEGQTDYVTMDADITSLKIYRDGNELYIANVEATSPIQSAANYPLQATLSYADATSLTSFVVTDTGDPLVYHWHDESVDEVSSGTLFTKTFSTPQTGDVLILPRNSALVVNELRNINAGWSYDVTALSTLFSSVTTLISNGGVLSGDVADLPASATRLAAGTGSTLSGIFEDIPNSYTDIVLGNNTQVGGTTVGMSNAVTKLQLQSFFQFMDVDIGQLSTALQLLAITENIIPSGNLDNKPAGLNYLVISKAQNITATDPVWPSTMDYVRLDGITDSAIVDIIYNTLARDATTWVGVNRLDMRFSVVRTAASDAAVTTLQGRGVDVRQAV